MSKFIQISSGIVIFLAGVFFSQFFLQPNDASSKTEKTNNIKAVEVDSVPKMKSELDSPNKTIVKPQADLINAQALVKQANKFSTQAFSKEKAKEVVSSLPDYQLESYIGNLVRKDSLHLLSDKRRFAENAVEALFEGNTNEQLDGQVLISNTSAIPEVNYETHTLTRKQKLYAHLNTFGKVQHGGHVFVKWVHRGSGDVVLFTMKRIAANSQTNWVSVVPDNAWETGTYDVKYYQLTSDLEPIAQTSYDVYEIK